LNAWRRIALGSWRDAGDPSVYGVIKLDMTAFVRRRARLKSEAVGSLGVPTLTAVMGRAIAVVMNRYPQLNGLIRFGTIYLRSNVDLFIQASVDEAGMELSGVRVEMAETKTIAEIMAEIERQNASVKSGEDPEFKRVKSRMGAVPPFFMYWVLKFTSFLVYTLNLDLTPLHIPRDPFGSVMITNVGSLGAELAFAPLIPYSRVPLLLAVGAVVDEAVVRDGKVVVAPVCNLAATMDHRFIDGVYGAKMMKLLRHFMETDEGLDELGFGVNADGEHGSTHARG
jgi:pyruvate dehydrogenase E2 component (dihydrolipoamide acetyltransferase)